MSGGSSSSPSQQGQPEQGSGEPQQREKTPDAPGEGPQKKGQKDEPKDSSDSQGEPKSPRESNADPRNQKGAPPPALDTEHVAADQANERWGDLPQQVRDLFRTEGGGDLPAQYRDWIDAYYRRLNQRR